MKIHLTYDLESARQILSSYKYHSLMRTKPPSRTAAESEHPMLQIRIGQAVEDTASGLKGIVIGKYDSIDGTTSWHVQPLAAADGKTQEALYLADIRLKAVSTHASIGLPTGKKSKGKRLPMGH